MNSTLTIRGARAVLPDTMLENATIFVEDGVIREIVTDGAKSGRQGGTVFDAGGRTVGPGFFDPHCHGDGTTRFFDDPNTVVKNLLRHGTTSVLATIGYPDMVRDGIGRQLDEFKAALQPQAKTVVAGVHLEGPYVNRKYGAQTSRGIIKLFDPVEYRELIKQHGDLIKWWTCAPELAGAAEFMTAATARGHIIAAGHTEATAEQIQAAIGQGLKVITHWTNATGNPKAAAYRGTRFPGIDEASLVFDELTAEIVPDEGGRHVHPLMAKLLYKTKGANRIMVITDAGYGRPDDPTDPALAKLDVSIDAAGDLAGSRLNMAGAARNFRAFTGCTLPELFRMTSLNTARLLGLDGQVGSIERGKQANLIVLDDGFHVTHTFLQGHEVAR